MHRGKETTEELKKVSSVLRKSHRGMSYHWKGNLPATKNAWTHTEYQQLCFTKVGISLEYIMFIHQLSTVLVTLTVKHSALFCVN